MDYLRPAREKVRRASVVGLVTASVVAGLASIGFCADMLTRRSIEFEGKPIWAGTLLVAILAVAAAWLARRLSNDNLSANGVTRTPRWFIQFLQCCFSSAAVATQ
jgi:hypothetical protein